MLDVIIHILKVKVFYVFLFDELEETLALQGDGNTEYDREMPNFFAVQTYLDA